MPNRSFDKVLIANRGEIACRVIAACREIGVRSVAVYSEADRDALHVRLADEGVAIGPAEAAASYLDIERLIAAAKNTGAGAIHPGYGFRAESAELADSCAANELVFIGPRAETLRALGDKRSARALARDAGVPVVPGFEGDLEGAARAAREIGYPVLVKAALGGGGKGMRRVESESELADALESAARVAIGAFGDSSVYIERCLDRARHIEIQILGDGAGGAVHLFERECSLQRRHQKLIEEAPSPVVDAALRGRMTQAACALASKASYLSAGTVEFLVAEDGEFYFLEVNARIQVEHPVTEMTTGVDLVKAQLRLARGGSLPAQDAIVSRGHAVEARIVAEDMNQDFLPQSGTLVRMDVPRYPFVRLDSGFDSGSVVPVHYDSMLAKVIVWGQDRDEAWDRLRMVLDGTIIHGVKTNLPLLRSLARDERVRRGDLHTTLLEDELLPAYQRASAVPVAPILIAAAALAETLQATAGRETVADGGDGDHHNPFRRLGRFRSSGVE